jgi:hypothetical protein
MCAASAKATRKPDAKTARSCGVMVTAPHFCEAAVTGFQAL